MLVMHANQFANQVGSRGIRQLTEPHKTLSTSLNILHLYILTYSHIYMSFSGWGSTAVRTDAHGGLYTRPLATAHPIDPIVKETSTGLPAKSTLGVLQSDP